MIDRFNKENGGNLKLARIEKGGKPAGLNLVRRYDMSEVLAQPKAFIPLQDMMAKAGQPLKVADLSADLKAGVVDGKGRLVALPLIYSTPVLFYRKCLAQGQARPGAGAEDVVRDAGHPRQASGCRLHLPIHHLVASLGARR